MNGVSLARLGWHTQALITCLEGWNHWRGQAQDMWPHWEQEKEWAPPWTTQTEWEGWLPWPSRGALARKMKKRCWTRQNCHGSPQLRTSYRGKAVKLWYSLDRYLQHCRGVYEQCNTRSSSDRMNGKWFYSCTDIEKRHVDTEGRREEGGWDEMGDWDWHIYTTMCKVDG